MSFIFWFSKLANIGSQYRLIFFRPNCCSYGRSCFWRKLDIVALITFFRPLTKWMLELWTLFAVTWRHVYPKGSHSLYLTFGTQLDSRLRSQPLDEWDNTITYRIDRYINGSTIRSRWCELCGSSANDSFSLPSRSTLLILCLSVLV